MIYADAKSSEEFAQWAYRGLEDPLQTFRSIDSHSSEHFRIAREDGRQSERGDAIPECFGADAS